MANLKFGFGKKLPMILQTEASECGLACLAMIANFHQYQTDLPEMRKRFAISLKGATLEHLIDIADQLGMVSRPLRIGMGHLPQLKLPAMLHWNLNHFVVLKAVDGDWVYIHDPAMGELKLSRQHVSDQFTGVALELNPGFSFKRKAANPPIQLRQLMGHIVGLKRGLGQIFVLAVALEILALVAPLLLQWITDEAIVTGDQNLLSMLGLGVIAVGVTSSLISTVRSWIGIYISTHFNMQWMSNVMSHLLKLPVSYFERRHLGDIVSRFGAVRAIERGMTSAVIDTLLDGMLGAGTLCMMLVFNPRLTMLTLAAVLLYGLLRWARYGSVRAASANAIMKEAKEQSYFLETIRGVRSIKLFGRESERRSAWMNLWVSSSNASLVSQRLQLLFDTSWALLSTFERAGVFWFGAAAVIDHQLSLGMLFAFLSYKDQFSQRINQLIDRVIEFKMLSIHGERLADIVLSEPEETREYRKHDLPEKIDMEFHRLSFRYSSEDSFIMNLANLHISEGECVAITGPSGSGKTTCMKLMLGILRPTSGKITIGGLSIKQIGLQGYRTLIATVMQDDNLFAGSLYDNICFLDAKPDEAWMYECTKAAAIHDEIVAMPMGYQTLVGDMGTVLSGGQKQRVLLARALYRRPKILFLDEATSHLDLENEDKINKAIAALRITRIMIAHRPQTIAIADRVISLDKGKLFQVHPSLPRPEPRAQPQFALAGSSG